MPIIVCTLVHTSKNETKTNSRITGIPAIIADNRTNDIEWTTRMEIANFNLTRIRETIDALGRPNIMILDHGTNLPGNHHQRKQNKGNRAKIDTN